MFRGGNVMTLRMSGPVTNTKSKYILIITNFLIRLLNLHKTSAHKTAYAYKGISKCTWLRKYICSQRPRGGLNHGRIYYVTWYMNLTQCILMESSIWSSKMSLGWSIVHIKGWLGLVECPSSFPGDCILTNIAYSDKLLSSAALQLGLHCFPNLSYTSIHSLETSTFEELGSEFINFACNCVINTLRLIVYLTGFSIWI